MKPTYLAAFTMLVVVSQAFAGIWTTLDYPGTAVTSTEAYGIDGSSIVGSYSDATGMHGFLFDGTDWFSFEYPDPQNFHNIAFGIDGNIIVGFYGPASGPIHGFLYDISKPEGSRWTTIDKPGASQISIQGIDGGNMVGAFWVSSLSSYPFQYDGTTWTTLPIPFPSSANGIDADTIVGQYEDSVTGTQRSYIYDKTTSSIIYHDYPGAIETRALDIDGGNIVGAYLDSSGLSHGYCYNGSGWTTLDVPGATWTAAYGIDGDQIVGYYRDVLGAHGFLYQPSVVPSPSALILGTIGLGMVYAKQRRQVVC